MATAKAKTQTFLARLPLFQEATPEDLDRIAVGTTEHRVAKGQLLFQRGDPCVGFHVVVYGQVKLAMVSPNGSEKVIDLIGPGHSFGEALMFTDRAYVVFAQALSDSLLLHISKAAIDAEIVRDPRLARRMIAGLSMRLHGLIQDVEAYSLRSGMQRVIGYLLRDIEEQSAGTPVRGVRVTDAAGRVLYQRPAAEPAPPEPVALADSAVLLVSEDRASFTAPVLLRPLTLSAAVPVALLLPHLLGRLVCGRLLRLHVGRSDGRRRGGLVRRVRRRNPRERRALPADAARARRIRRRHADLPHLPRTRPRRPAAPGPQGTHDLTPRRCEAESSPSAELTER